MFCVNLWISKLSLESLGWQESVAEALFEQFGRFAERNWNATKLTCYCVCPIGSHCAASHKYFFSPRLSNRPHRCGRLTFFAQCIMAHQIYNIYTVKQWSPQCIFTWGASLFKEETFHMRICLSKLVVTMEWLFKALIHSPHTEMKDHCVLTQDFSTRCCAFCLNVSVEGNV